MSSKRFTKADAEQLQRLHEKLLAECQRFDERVKEIGLGFDELGWWVWSTSVGVDTVIEGGETLYDATITLLHKLAGTKEAPF